MTAGLIKAKLRVVAGETPQKEMEFRFNPSEYTVTKGATWNRPQSSGAKSASKPQFGGSNPQTVQMEVFFDDWESRKGMIAQDVATLLEWTKPTPTSVQKKKPEPPILAFEWGKNLALANFNAYLKSVSVKFTLFDIHGNPLRATANITLEEVPVDAAKQNPTSGGRMGYRSHTLQQGESLHSLAFQEYGEAGFWRALAHFNGIDDPLRVRPGTTVLVPEVSEASRLA